MEKIEEVNVKGEAEKQKVFVDVWRRYGMSEDGDEAGWPVEERRTLVFMPQKDPVSEPKTPSRSKMIKCKPFSITLISEFALV